MEVCIISENAYPTSRGGVARARGVKPRLNAGTLATLPKGSPRLKPGEDVTESRGCDMS